MKRETTMQKIALYLETLNVPNPERLNSKPDDFIFDLGVFIISPLIENETLSDIREQINLLLDYNSFDEASDALEKKTKDRIKSTPGLERFLAEAFNGTLGGPNVKVHVIDLSKMKNGGRGGMTEEDFNKRLELTKLVSGIQKVSELMAIAQKLGKNLQDPTYFNRLSDLSKLNIDWFDKVYVFLTDLMSDDHYKTCECVSKKFDTLVFSDSEKDAWSKWGGGVK